MVWIPSHALIAQAKLTEYLLTPRTWDDKAGFLTRAGFDRSSPDILEAAIRRLASQVEATEDGRNDYGIFWKLNGILLGPTGRELAVSLIWLQDFATNQFRFITLKPWRR